MYKLQLIPCIIIHSIYVVYVLGKKRRMMSSLNVYQRAVYNILDRVTWLDVSCVSLVSSC
jgi:hypothetical protein